MNWSELLSIWSNFYSIYSHNHKMLCVGMGNNRLNQLMCKLETALTNFVLNLKGASFVKNVLCVRELFVFSC